MYRRLPNGAKPRWDGKGDSWAKAHRECLPRNVYMVDVDAMEAFHIYGSPPTTNLWIEKTADRIWIEYTIVERSVKSMESSNQLFGVIAFFERKHDWSFTRKKIECGFERTFTTDPNKNLIAALRRMISRQMSYTPRHFYIVGGDNGPWEIQEIDEWGYFVGHAEEFTRETINDKWRELGLLRDGERLNDLMRKYEVEFALSYGPQQFSEMLDGEVE